MLLPEGDTEIRLIHVMILGQGSHGDIQIQDAAKVSFLNYE